MKKTAIVLLSLILICSISFGQPIINRAPATNTVQDGRLTTLYNLFVPKYSDTTAANLQKGIDSCSAIIFTYDRMALWFRSCSGGKRWVMLDPSGVPSTSNSWVIGGNLGLFTSPVSPQYAGTRTNQGFGLLSNNLARLTFNEFGAWGLGTGLDYGTAGQTIISQGSGAIPIWGAGGGGGGLTSVGLSMPSAFTVSNSPLIANGTLSVTGAGTTAQYIRGDGSLATYGTGLGYWKTDGNSGTTAGTNFIGTTDSVDLVIKTKGIENTRITPLGKVDIVDATGKRQLTLDPVNKYWAIGDHAGDFGNAVSIHMSDSNGTVRIDGDLNIQGMQNDAESYDPANPTRNFPAFYNSLTQYIGVGSGIDSMWRPSADSIRFRVRSNQVGKAGIFGIYAPTYGGTVTSVSGTANQIASTGGTTPVLSLVSGGTLPGAWVLGTPASGTLTNATGLPPTTGIVGWPANASGSLTNDGSGGLTWVAGGGAGMAINGAITSATAGSVLFAGTGGILQQKNSDFFYDSTNKRLGIGTNAPDATIEARANSSNFRARPLANGNTPGYEITADGGTLVASFTGNASSGENRLFNTSSHYLTIYTDGGEKMRIKTDGNVGIGVTNPTGVLHLKAGTTAASTAPLKLSHGSSTTTPEAGTMEYNGAFQLSKFNNVRFGIGGNLTTNVTTVGNVTTGVDDLMTYSIPAGTLSTDGDYIEFTMSFVFAGNANSKQIQVLFGGTTIYASGAQLQNGGAMEIRGTIIKTGAATQRITFQQGNNTTLFADYANYVTAGETLSGAITLKATGEGVSTDDITQPILTVKYFPSN